MTKLHAMPGAPAFGVTMQDPYPYDVTNQSGPATYAAHVRFGTRVWEGPRRGSPDEATAALVFMLAEEAHGERP